SDSLELIRTTMSGQKMTWDALAEKWREAPQNRTGYVFTNSVEVFDGKRELTELYLDGRFGIHLHAIGSPIGSGEHPEPVSDCVVFDYPTDELNLGADARESIPVERYVGQDPERRAHCRYVQGAVLIDQRELVQA